MPIPVRPGPIFHPVFTTEPARAAYVGPPPATSMPAWKPPQRDPNSLVIGPDDGRRHPPWSGGAVPSSEKSSSLPLIQSMTLSMAFVATSPPMRPNVPHWPTVFEISDLIGFSRALAADASPPRTQSTAFDTQPLTVPHRSPIAGTPAASPWPASAALVCA